MKLYYSPGACSLGIHALLVEIGKPFTLEKVNFAEAAQYKPPYATLNPKSKVPVLERDDGTIITEFSAIAWYLAKTNPDAGLLPTDIEGETRLLELMDYLIATIHMRGFTRIFRPSLFTPNKDDEAQVIETGKTIVLKGFEILALALGDQDYLLGRLSIADCALFFLEFWAAGRAGLELPPAFAAHLARMKARPSVQQALATEGLS